MLARLPALHTLSRKICFGLSVGVLLSVLVLFCASRFAGAIFNYVMERQNILLGSVTVETISADIFGNVAFEGLDWRDTKGRKILFVPNGNFRVRLYDCLTGNFKSTTIQEMTLNDAEISLRFDENMQLDFVPHSRDFKRMKQEDKDSWQEKISYVNKTEAELEEIAKRRQMMRERELRTGWRNFNREGKHLRMKLALNRCRAEIFYRDRHYLFSGLSFNADINTTGMNLIRLYTGKFGGTMIGQGLTVCGKIDCTDGHGRLSAGAGAGCAEFAPADMPVISLTTHFKEVNPSSLGMGMNIKDNMTLKAHFQGSLLHPVAHGTVEMQELHIPGLDFRDVKGDIDYDNALLTFSNVTASVYDGTLTAYGDYNIDTRRYSIHGLGEDLHAARALKKEMINCTVHLKIDVDCPGDVKKTVTTGAFRSGGGHYRLIPFQSISGSFKNEYHDLKFYDLAIELGRYNVKTDYLEIKDGKLIMRPVHLLDEQGISRFVYDREKDEQHPAP